MKKIRIIAALVLAVLMMVTATGCGANALLVGTWEDASTQTKMEFDKDGNAIITVYSIPLPATYEYSGDTLTIYYSEEITQSGTLTFFGDDEFCWENTDSDGTVYQDYYTRTN